MTQEKTLIDKVKIKVNCMCAYPKHLIQESDYKGMELAVKSYKKTKEWEKTEKNEWDYYEGRRFNDNDRIVHVILCNMKLAINTHLFDNPHGDTINKTNEQLMEDAFLLYATSIESTIINQWINAALIYSAGCDHWYTFEKEW